MKLLWDSRQGAQRKANCDFLGVFNNKEYLVCFLIDAAERTPRSKVFVAEWTRYFIGSVAALSFIDVDDLKQVLQAGFEQWRRKYLNEIASYCCLLVVKKTGKLVSLSLGDCRIGSAQTCGFDINWQNSIHTLANALGEPLADTLLMSSSRNQLTRSLNARRFESPSVKEIQGNCCLYMATDGFWVGNQLQASLFDDDSSHLKIELLPLDVFEFTAVSANQNYYLLNDVSTAWDVS